MMTGLVDGAARQQDLSWFDYSTVEGISADGRVVLFNETGEGGGAHHAVYIRRANAPSAIRVGEGFGMAISPDGNWVVTKPDGDQTTLNLVPLTPGQPRTLSGHNMRYDFVRVFPGGTGCWLAAALRAASAFLRPGARWQRARARGHQRLFHASRNLRRRQADRRRGFRAEAAGVAGGGRGTESDRHRFCLHRPALDPVG